MRHGFPTRGFVAGFQRCRPWRCAPFRSPDDPRGRHGMRRRRDPWQRVRPSPPPDRSPCDAFPLNLPSYLAYTAHNSRLLEQERQDIEVSGSGTHHRSGKRKGRVGQIHDRHACGHRAGAAGQGWAARPRPAAAKPRALYREPPEHDRQAQARPPCPILMDLPPIDPATLPRARTSMTGACRPPWPSTRRSCDFIVIDCPGSHTRLSQVAHSLADTLITPMNDSFVDFDLLGAHRPRDLRDPRAQRLLRDGLACAAASGARGAQGDGLDRGAQPPRRAGDAQQAQGRAVRWRICRNGSASGSRPGFPNA
jgi:hypothetical protein